MKKTISALLVAATVAGALAATAPAAEARDGRGVAAGIAGGLIGGAIIGGALAAGAANAAPPPPGYYGRPAPVYVDEPMCRMERERFWDGYGWRMRRVEVCN